MLRVKNTSINFDFHSFQVNRQQYYAETAQLAEQLQNVQQEMSKLKLHMRQVSRARMQSSHPQHDRDISTTSSRDETSLWSPDLAVSSSPSHKSNTSSEQFSLKRHQTLFDLSQIDTPSCTNPQEFRNSPMSQDYIGDCVRHLVFGDSRVVDTMNYSSELSSTDSGYTSIPSRPQCDGQVCDEHDYTTIRIRSNDQSDDFSCSYNAFVTDASIDSDATTFFNQPLTHPAVTHNDKKHRSIAKQIKQMSKKMHKRGLENMKTLAVL